MSKTWFCRVDGQKEFLSGKLKEILGWVDCVRLLGAHHIGSKKEHPHIHFVIELSSELQKQSFDTRFKKVFNPDKKSDFSTKPWDLADAPCSYLFHEPTADVIVNRGFSDDDISRFKKLNEGVQSVIAVNKGRGPARIVDRIVTEIGSTYVDRKDILGKLVKLIYAGEMYEPGDYKLKSIVEEIYLKSRSKDEIKEYIDQRYANLFRS